MKYCFSLTSVLLIFTCYLNAQILNTERLRMFTGDQPLNLSGGANFGYDNNDGNYIFRLGMRIGGLLKTKDKKGVLNNKFFIHANYRLVRSEDQDFSNSWIAHFRYNKEFNNTLRTEAFLQSQENRLLSIDSRNLVGVGVRLRLTKEDNKRLHMYLGSAYMYEIERSDDLNLKLYNHRSSSYWTVTYRLKDNDNNIKFLFINTLYYQPLFSDFQNYRLSNDFSIEFPISDEVTFDTSFNYFHNNRTPLGDAEYMSYLSIGINYNIKITPKKKAQLNFDGGKI